MGPEIDAGSPQDAARALRAGKMVLVPTETVVGLLATKARPLNAAKNSDPDKPLTLLCASAERAFGLARTVPPLARTLAGRFWPGPLTLVLDLPYGGTVGVRVPGGKATEVLGALGEPVYATSANLSGEPAPASLRDVDPRVVRAADLMVLGDPGDGEPSAVVDLSGGRVRLLRPTRELSEEDLEKLPTEEPGDANA